MAKIEKQCLQCGGTMYVYQSHIKRGGGKFCSYKCGTTYRNLHDNPSKRPEVREKISKNHADVSGEKNPMYGRRGKNATQYIDGRYSIESSAVYRRIAFTHLVPICEYCGETETKKLDVHHRDENRNNNDINNLVFVCEKCHYTKAHRYIRDEKGRFLKKE